MKYLAFSGVILVNLLSTHINLPLTQQFSASTPYGQYLTATADGEIVWAIGAPEMPCNPSEGGITLSFPDQNQIELFTIVVDAGPGDRIEWGTGPQAEIQYCNAFATCEQSVEVTTTGSLTLNPFPSPPDCQPEVAFTYTVGDSPLSDYAKSVIVAVSGLQPNVAIRYLDGCIDFEPDMIGANVLEYIPAVYQSLPANIVFETRKKPDGAFSLCFKATFSNPWIPGSSSFNLFEVALGQYNFSAGGKVHGKPRFGRFEYEVGSSGPQVCVMEAEDFTADIPGHPMCDGDFRLIITQITSADCDWSLRFTVRHNAQSPRSVNRFFIKFLFNVTINSTISNPAVTLPCSNCGTLTNIGGSLWTYIYEDNNPSLIANGAYIDVPFNAPVGCIEWFIVMAEAADPNDHSCALNPIIQAAYPACKTSLTGAVSIPYQIPEVTDFYRVQLLNANTNQPISQQIANDCQYEFRFCVPNILGPFKVKAQSFNPQFFLCGVTTYDMALIYRHIFSIAPLAPYREIAANVNLTPLLDGKQEIGKPDIDAIRDLILGKNDDFGPNGAPSWRYMRANYSFPKPLEIDFTGLDEAPISNTQYPSFYQIKMGDVNESCRCVWSRPEVEDRRSVGPLWRFDTDRAAGSDGAPLIQIRAVYSGSFEAHALQAGFRFDPSRMRLKSIEYPDTKSLTAHDFGRSKEDEGQLRFAWYAQTYHFPYDPYKPGEALFTLIFEALDPELVRSAGTAIPLWLSDETLSCLAYDRDGQAYAFEGEFSGRSAAQPILVMHPNPASEQAQLLIRAAEAGEYRLALNDAQGRLLREETLRLEEGEHRYVWPIAQFPAGVYTFVLRRGDARSVVRWVK